VLRARSGGVCTNHERHIHSNGVIIRAHRNAGRWQRPQTRARGRQLEDRSLNFWTGVCSKFEPAKSCCSGCSWTCICQLKVAMR